MEKDRLGKIFAEVIAKAEEEELLAMRKILDHEVLDNLDSEVGKFGIFEVEVDGKKSLYHVQFEDNSGKLYIDFLTPGEKGVSLLECKYNPIVKSWEVVKGGESVHNSDIIKMASNLRRAMYNKI